MQQKKFLPIVLCFSIVFFSIFAVNVRQAKAWPVSMAIGNFIPETGSMISGLGSLAKTILTQVVDIAKGILVTASKVAALMIVQKITQAIIGKGDAGDAKGGIITDWDQYLNIGPQQKAMAQMNSFFNNATKGRSSSLNYEGVNSGASRYQNYLIAEAKKSYTPQTFVIDIQDTVTDPGEFFAGENMKGIMAYTKHANNPASIALIASQTYASEVAKAKEIALSEQDKGILPVKKGGVITQPAAIAGSALSQIDQLGTTLIMNADYKSQGYAGAATQIAAGIGVSVASRSLNYAVADKEGKAAIQNSNGQPFSLSYSANGGIGINGAGVNVNTGMGTISGQMMIGNTCASAAATAQGANATVTVQGKKYECATKTEAAAKAPSVTITEPIVTIKEPTVSAKITQ